MIGYVSAFESFGLVDGPGIRNVVFFDGCLLRCKYCHNPEMWQRGKNKITSDELVRKILRNKPYFQTHGGVTFSGGEPLLQRDFLLETCKKLKKEKIHIALDTAGVGTGKYQEILSLVDLVILDIKHTEEKAYLELTGKSMKEVTKFIDVLNQSGKKVWIRQVIIPGLTDQLEYLKSLVTYLKQIKNIEKVEFLPFHHLGFEKYVKLKQENPFLKVPPMDSTKCEKIYQDFLKICKKEKLFFKEGLK